MTFFLATNLDLGKKWLQFSFLGLPDCPYIGKVESCVCAYILWYIAPYLLYWFWIFAYYLASIAAQSDFFVVPFLHLFILQAVKVRMDENKTKRNEMNWNI